MKTLALMLAASVSAAGFAGVADARPHHPIVHHRHCGWVMMHHHKVRRCR